MLCRVRRPALLSSLSHDLRTPLTSIRGAAETLATGLCRAIARAFLAAMGGTIEAESPRPDLPRDGSPGARITFHLPAALPA